MSVFLIIFSDEIPSADITPRCVYGTIEAAEAALNKLIGGIKSFSPALYGEVYPFENTTARAEIASKGRAVYGWAKDLDDDGDVIQYGIFIEELPCR